MQNIELKGWILIVVIGLSIVSICSIIDFFLKRQEVRAIHDKFLKIAYVLSNTSFKHWQINIAECGVIIFQTLHDKTAKIASILLYSFFYFLENKLEISNNNIKRIVIGILLLVLPLIYFLFKTWIIGTVSFPLILLSLAILYATFGWRDRHSLFDFWTATSIISTILSLIAIFTTILVLPKYILNTEWFHLNNNLINPSKPFLLPIINFPFDLATILTTIVLLQILIRKGKFITIIALLDIIFSACFSILLYTSLKIVENNWDFFNYSSYLIDSIEWFKKIAIYALSFIIKKPVTFNIKDLRDLHLLPILLTTFFPVFLYMTVFIFLSFSRIVFRISGRFFEVVGEREESVFKQFGILITTILVTIKAIYDYLSL